MKKLNLKWNVCIVSGFGWSGSGAVIDVLKELSCVKTFDVEYRGIKDPYGIQDLEKALTQNWDLLNSDFAMDNFLKLSKMHGNENSKISKYYLSYKSKINRDFHKLTQDYAHSLVSTKINFTWWQKHIHSNWAKSIFAKFLAKINHIPSSFLAAPGKEKFLLETTRYLERLFNLNDEELKVLDQAISPNNLDSLKYFKKPKMIIVDRNPYDVLTDLRLNNAFFSSKDSINAFSIFYKESRACLQNIPDDNVYLINFEDLVNNYKETHLSILKFLDLDTEIYSPTFERFDPDISKKNVGIFKQYLTNEEVSMIGSLLEIEPPIANNDVL